MSEQRYLYIDGQRIPVSEEFYKEYHKYTRKEKYFSADLKREKFIYDPEKGIAVLLPGREDSYERLLEQDKQFAAPDTELPEDAVVKAELLEKLDQVLTTLSDDELRLIQELFYLERTEREASAALNMALSTLHRRKNSVLKKLRDLLENSFENL